MSSKEEQLENIKAAIEMYNSNVKERLTNLTIYVFDRVKEFTEDSTIFKTRLGIINKQIKELKELNENKERLECQKKT